MNTSLSMEEQLPECPKQDWFLGDALEKNHHRAPRFPLAAFNHVTREVLDLEKSKKFYCDILGFYEIPRPAFEAEGAWLYGNNLNLHLIKTRHPADRRKLKISRIQHFSRALPTVDHMAFTTTDINLVREVLDSEDVYYKFEELKGTGTQQIFLFDPDGNVIEISVFGEPTNIPAKIRGESDDIIVDSPLRRDSDDLSNESLSGDEYPISN